MTPRPVPNIGYAERRTVTTLRATRHSLWDAESGDIPLYRWQWSYPEPLGAESRATGRGRLAFTWLAVTLSAEPIRDPSRHASKEPELAMNYPPPPPPPPPPPAPTGPEQALSHAIASAVAAGWQFVSRTENTAILSRGGHVRHLMHGIISLLTCGLWLFGWAIVAILGARQVLTFTVDEMGVVHRQDPKSRAPYVAGVIGVFILLAIIGSVLPGSDDTDSTATADSTESQAATTSDTSSAPAKASAAAKPSAKPKPKPKPVWKVVTTLAGSNNKQGKDFHLHGCETRLDYTVGGGQFAGVNIYVVDSGDQLMKDGGIPEVAMADKSDTTQIRRDEGDYYLDVVAANTTWSIKVEERC